MSETWKDPEVFNRAVKAVQDCLTGKGEVEPTSSREFYMYVAECVIMAMKENEVNVRESDRSS